MPTLNEAVIEALKAWRDEHLPEETTGDILHYGLFPLLTDSTHHPNRCKNATPST